MTKTCWTNWRKPNASSTSSTPAANEAEFALSERKRRCSELKEAAHRLEFPQEVSNRDESAVRQQVADLRDRASHHEKEITELEKTLATLANEIAAMDKAAVGKREKLLMPLCDFSCRDKSLLAIRESTVHFGGVPHGV